MPDLTILKYKGPTYQGWDKSQWRFEHVLRKVRPEEEDGNGRNEEEGSSKEEEVSLIINRWRHDQVRMLRFAPTTIPSVFRAYYW